MNDNETSHHVKPSTIYSSLLHRERARFFRPLLPSPYAHRELNTAVRGSTFLVEKMKLYDKLSKHDGCVNSVLFSNCGEYIYTGSDDTHVHIYNTHTRKLLLDLPTAHVENIFYAKELSSSMPDWVLTCAADGQVLLTHAPTRMRKRVFHHEGRAHRIAHWPQSESSFFSCGEDGACCLFDLRDHVRRDGTCADQGCFPKLIIHFANAYNDSQSIFSIGVNPSNPNEIALAGESNAVSLYDVRKAFRPTGHLCPAVYQLSDESDTHITGIKYSPDGELLFASYSEGDVYSFWVKEHTRANAMGGCQCEQEEQEDEESDDDESCPPLEGDEEEEEEDDDNEEEEESDRISRSSRSTGMSSHSSTSASRGFYKRYHGHRNADTVKQVGCYGNRGEFVVSGSDCGHIFIWDTHTAGLVKMLKADSIGAVNCISAHPTMPMLATSGLERDAKLWLPVGEHLPLVAGSKELKKAEQVMHDNATRPSRSSMMNHAMLRQLMMMLAGASGGRFAVPFPDDDSEGDEEEEERGFGEDSSSENSEESASEDEDHYDSNDEDDDEEEDDDGNEEEVDFRGQRRTRDGDDDHESPHRPSRRRRSEGSAHSSSSVPVPLIGVVTRRRSSSENEEDDAGDEDMPPLEWSGDEESGSDADT